MAVAPIDPALLRQIFDTPEDRLRRVVDRAKEQSK